MPRTGALEAKSYSYPSLTHQPEFYPIAELLAGMGYRPVWLECRYTLMAEFDFDVVRWLGSLLDSSESPTSEAPPEHGLLSPEISPAHLVLERVCRGVRRWAQRARAKDFAWSVHHLLPEFSRNPSSSTTSVLYRWSKRAILQPLLRRLQRDLLRDRYLDLLGCIRA